MERTFFDFDKEQDTQELCEKQSIVNMALSARGISTEGLSFRDAVARLEESVGVGNNKKSFEVSFGEYGLQATDYDVITEENIERVRKYLSAQKKMLRGCKVNVRIFATVEYSRKKYLGVILPNLVLWELSGITEENAQNIASDVAEILQTPLRVASINTL